MKSRKIVINATHGGFGLSPEAILDLYCRGSISIVAQKVEDFFPENDDGSPFSLDEQIHRWREYLSLGTPLNPFQTYFSPDEMFVLTYQKIARDDCDLVDVVEKLGAKANGPVSTLEVIEIPGDVVWQIEECEGLEHVAEAHRTWFGKDDQAWRI
jgi:hypothetical protein